MTNIETPEGWERSGPCFTRVYDGKLAVLELDETLNGAYPFVFSKRGTHHRCGFRLMNDAVAWANEQLGVPKPVEVVEREFADGSVLIHDTERNRWSVVLKSSGVWVSVNVGTHFTNKETALEAARRYVRGDA